MTHIIGCVEGYWEYLDKFLNYFHGKTYANGRAKVRARFILPVHFGINECGKEEFLADLKSFSSGLDFKFNKKNKHRKKTGLGIKSRLGFFSKMFRLLFPQIKDIQKEMNNIKSTNLREIEGKKGNHFILAFYPIGEIKDYYDNGTEIV